jgi:hypothetical protein
MLHVLLSPFFTQQWRVFHKRQCGEVKLENIMSVFNNTWENHCTSSNVKNSFKKCNGEARCWRLKPVILATQEAEIRSITVRSQPQANSSRDPISKNPSQKRACRVAQGVGPEFNPPKTAKKQKYNGCYITHKLEKLFQIY